MGVSAWFGGVVYGDLNGDGADEAALSVECDNRGGTADGQLRFTWVVFQAAGSKLKALAVITSRQPRQRLADHVPLLGYPVTIWPGGITVPEAWYGPNDSTCCSTGRAETIWRLGRGHLHPARTIVFRRPSPTTTFSQFPDVRYLRDGSVVSVTRTGKVTEWDARGRFDSESFCFTYARYLRWVRFFSAFRTAVLIHDRSRAASFFTFPFHWNHGRQTTTIRSLSAFLRRYSDIFTASVVAQIRAALTQAPFCKDVTTAMLGPGVVWASEFRGRSSIFAVNGA